MNIKYVSLFISLLASLVKSDLPPVPNGILKYLFII